jgi:hypothetical protein
MIHFLKRWTLIFSIVSVAMAMRTEAFAQEKAAFQKEKESLSPARDPFRLPPEIRLLSKIVPAPPAKDMPPPLPPLEVKAILIGTRLRLASIDRQIVTVGDQIGGERILEIGSDRVILVKEGKKRTLHLKQSPVGLIVEETKVKGEKR